MPMEEVGEGAQNRLSDVGGNALDDQAIAGDANRDHGTVDQQECRAATDRIERRRQRGMAGRIHRRPVQRER